MQHLKLEVTRTQSTILYVSVPDDFDPKDAMQAKYTRKLGKIALETLNSFDWDDADWENTIEVIGCEPVTDAEARAYKVGVLVPEKGGDK